MLACEMKNTTLMWILGGVVVVGAATAGGIYLAKKKGAQGTANAAASGTTPSGSATKPTPATSPPPNQLPPGSYDAAIDLLNATAPISTAFLKPNENPNARPEQLV